MALDCFGSSVSPMFGQGGDREQPNTEGFVMDGACIDILAWWHIIAGKLDNRPCFDCTEQVAL